MMITRKCVATVWLFVATGLKCFMKLHKCWILLNYGTQVFLPFRCAFFFLYFFFLYFLFFVGRRRALCRFHYKRLGNCAVESAFFCFVGQFALTHLAFATSTVL